jgi:hypothetical protein
MHGISRNRTPEGTVGMAVLLTLVAASGQNGTPEALHSITGVVREVGSGKPVPNGQVFTFTHASFSSGATSLQSNSRKIKAETDANGNYVLAGLPDGRYSVTAFARGLFRSEQVTVAGSDVTLGFDVPAGATISGRVEDAHGEPLPGAAVDLFSKEYQAGVLRLVTNNHTTANDAGEYEFHNVDSDRAWFIVAQRGERPGSAVSAVPREIAARRPVLVPTWFPGSPSPDEASPVTVREAGRTEAVDIRLLESPNWCIEGTLETSSGPAALWFFLAWSSISNPMPMLSQQTASDGRFRMCGLYPGAYELSAARFSSPGDKEIAPPLFASTEVVLGKKDVTGIRLVVQPGLLTEGKAVFDTADQNSQPGGRASLFLDPIGRYSFLGEKTGGNTSVPGEFSLPIVLDDYVVHAHCAGAGLYVKDVTYGGSSVLRAPLSGSRMRRGAEFQIVCGAGAASLDAIVADKDGKGLSDMSVVAVPSDAVSASQMSTAIAWTQTDQNGQCSLTGLPPGKYRVLAVAKTVEGTPEALGALSSALLSKAKDVEVGPNQRSSVLLAPSSLN